MDHIEPSLKPAENIHTHWKFLGTSMWGIVVAGLFLFFQVVTTFVVIFAQKSHLTEKQFLTFLDTAGDNGVLLSLSTYVTTILCSLVLAGIIKLRRGLRLLDYLAIRPVPVTTFLKWLGVTAVFILASDALTVMLGRPLVPPDVARSYETTYPVWLIWVALVLCAPFFEELFFRGFLYKGYAASPLRPVGAIAITAFLWAIIHVQYDVYGIATVFGIGIIIGLARWRTDSILVPMAMHALMNLVAAIEAAWLV